uniref:Uncharacterized protein n=1 Tax=Anguilla anguilla TaxID=7936 RepID=A0A0E9VTD1_ANGAN
MCPFLCTHLSLMRVSFYFVSNKSHSTEQNRDKPS